MGAPNAVRGGSQVGNNAAMELIEDGLCDALVSDYCYPRALVQAVWAVTAQRTGSFGAAWGLVSTRDAALIRVEDRGRLAPGLRADLVVMNPATRRVEGTIAQGRLTHLAGALGGRFVAAGLDRALAAA